MLITDKNELKEYYACHRVWQGIPGIEITKGGRTFVSFYSGNISETYGNYTVLIKSDDGINFSEPIAVCKKEGNFRCYDPLIWIDPLNRLWFIWNVMPGEEVYASICENPDADELKWSKEFYIGRGTLLNKPTVLSSGEWLFPIALWCHDLMNNLRKSYLTEDDIAGSYVYKTSDNGKTFVKLGFSDIPYRSFDEHMIYEMDNGVLRMIVRLNYGIGESYSYDRGNKWSCGNIFVKGPSSRPFIRKLSSGNVIFIHHKNTAERTNLTAFLSKDDGNTFPYFITLDDRMEVSYPDAKEDENGFIHIVYDRERGCFKNSLSEAYSSSREIITAKITEEDIINGNLVNSKSYLRHIASKLGTLADGDSDPFKDNEIPSKEFAKSLIESNIENPVDKVFEKYPLNCANTEKTDRIKIDSLIAQFKESGNRDEKILIKIIDTIKKIPEKKNAFPVVEMVSKYINENLCEDITVSEISEKFNISIYYLSHIFKSVTGTTITEYRNELRLTKAKMLLIKTDMNITDIAKEVGFNSSSYFTEVFSKSEEISPKKYRELHQ